MDGKRSPSACRRGGGRNIDEPRRHPVRRKDAWGKPSLRVGDVVPSVPLKDDPGTVVKIRQVNANGAWVVAVKWFTWDGGRTTEEYITELELMSEA